MMQNLRVTQMGTGLIGVFLSRSRPAKFLVLAIIFFASTQLGLHLWPQTALVYGIRIDYLSPTLYFLDILIIVYLFMSRKFHKLIIGNWLLVILLVNLLFTSNPLATLSWSLHLLLYSTFIFSLPRIYLLESISYILPATLLFQALLASIQVFLGHSVGGLMYYLGERSVAVGPPGIALGTFMGHVVLRGYGTFSHPNVLAGWSIVALLITLRLGPEFRSLRDSRRVIGTFAILLTTYVVMIAQSRSALIALFGLILPFYLIRKIRYRLLYFGFMVFCSFSFFSILTPPRSDLSFSERRTLQGVSLSAIRSFPIFGTGAQASISTYPSVAPGIRLLQPDHDSFTLFLSWFGVFGVLAILYSLRPILASSLYLLAPLAPLLALDHYFLTSPQGLFIFLLYLRVALNYRHAQKDL